MAYVPTTFVDRSVEFPNRRTFTAVSGQADTFDVARAEGTVFAEGTKPDAENLNAEFGKIKTEIDSKVSGFESGDYESVTGLAYDSANKKLGLKVGADTVIPFSSGMKVALGSQTGSGYKTIDCTGISGYDSLTANNFLLDVVSYGYQYVRSTAGNETINKSYNASTGILTLAGLGVGTLGGTNQYIGVTVNVYCVKVS